MISFFINCQLFSTEYRGNCQALQGDNGKLEYIDQYRIMNSNTNKTQKNKHTISDVFVFCSSE